MITKNKLFKYYSDLLNQLKQKDKEQDASISIEEYLMPTIKERDFKNNMLDIGTGVNKYGQYRKSIRLAIPIVGDERIEELWELIASTWSTHSSRINWEYDFIGLYVDIEGWNDEGDQINVKKPGDHMRKILLIFGTWLKSRNKEINNKNNWLLNQWEEYLNEKKEQQVQVQADEKVILNSVKHKLLQKM